MFFDFPPSCKCRRNVSAGLLDFTATLKLSLECFLTYLQLLPLSFLHLLLFHVFIALCKIFCSSFMFHHFTINCIWLMLFLHELKQVLALIKQFSFINRNVSLKHMLLTWFNIRIQFFASEGI